MRSRENNRAEFTQTGRWKGRKPKLKTVKRWVGEAAAYDRIMDQLTRYYP